MTDATKIETPSEAALPDAPNAWAYKEDHRKDNPGLHLLYTRWACTHLTAIDQMIRRLEGFSNLNMLDILQAMYEQREKLVQENAAYAEAHYMLLAASKGKELGEEEEG